MRPKVIAAIVGLWLTVGGVGALAYGVLRLSVTTTGECSGDDCLADPWILGFPLGIVAMVFGLIIGSWALGSIREERGSTSPLRVFGFMSGLGAVFVALGVIFLSITSTAGQDGSMLFVGGLFGVMGLIFIGVDLVRFRGELKKDRLRVSGLKGTARVLDVRDTNVTVNNSPMVNLDLEVTVPGQSPFRTHKRTVISRLSVGALTPGTLIPVLADANKPRDIVLDWESGTTAPAGADPANYGGFNAWFPHGSQQLFQGAYGTMNADLLRNVSQALQRAADRADAGGAGVSRMANGTTVIDGGTTVLVNGQPVPLDAHAALASLPSAIAAAFGAGAFGAGAFGASATTGVPVIDGSASAGSAGPAGTGSPVVPGLGGTPLLSGPASSVGPATPPLVPNTLTPSAAPSPPPAADLPLPIGDTGAGSSALPARVSLDSITDTGVDIAGNRLYTFDLTVSVAGRSPYKIKHAAVVPKPSVPRLIRGASFPARVDPAIPGQIAIAWDH